MKKATLTFIICLSVLLSNAQLHCKLGLGACLPVGDMSDSWAAGAQAELNVKYLIKNHIGVGITSGYQHFFETDWGGVYDDISYEIIPLRLTGSYDFGNGVFRPFLGVELGVNFTNLEYTYIGYYVFNGSTYYESVDRSAARFGAAPAFGFLVNFGHVVGMDLAIRYNFVESDDTYKSEKTSYVSTTLGLVFKIGERE